MLQLLTYRRIILPKHIGQCVICGKGFVCRSKTRTCCFGQCEEDLKCKNRLEKWSQGNYHEMAAKRAKKNRVIGEMLDWAATMCNDPVNKRYRVMRG